MRERGRDEEDIYEIKIKIIQIIWSQSKLHVRVHGYLWLALGTPGWIELCV